MTSENHLHLLDETQDLVLAAYQYYRAYGWSFRRICDVLGRSATERCRDSVTALLIEEDGTGMV